MQKIRIVCLNNDKHNIISSLYKIGMIDLRKSKLSLNDDIPEEDYNYLSDMEIKLDGAIALLKKPKKIKSSHIQLEKHINFKELISKINKFEVINKIYEISGKKKKAQQNLHFLEASESVAKQLFDININFDSLSSSFIIFKAYSAHSFKEINAFKHEIKNKHLQIEIVESEDKKSTNFIVAYEKSINIEDISKKYKFNEIDISLNYLHGSPKEALANINKIKAEEYNKIKEADLALLEISKNNYQKMFAYNEMLRIEITKAKVNEIFKKTDSTIIIEGWVPQKKSNEIKAVVAKASKGRYYIEELPSDELAPTLFNRPKIFQPFEYLINFMSVPRSDELDPTIPFIISFPIFYGLMVSDVGYGILSFFFATYITKITNPDGLVYNTSKIWQLSSISAIFFGFLSNQYFGLQFNQYIIPGFVGFDWFTNITSILVVAVVFGLIQIIIGLLFGFINNYKHHKKLAYSKLTSIVLMITGTIAIAGGLFMAFNSQITMLSAEIAIVALILTLALSGSEAGEITNLISHPLSYARIAGFGLASIVLAFLIDKAFTPNLSMGIPLFILYFIIFIVLHFLNMIVSMFEGAVQGARLNFIEFFTKFYKGGGVKFNPFSYKRVYTKE
jgi:V/A-type H+-transporting ATPase subunit I